MSGLGQKQTSRHRPHHVRYSSESGHPTARFARPLSARSGRVLPHAARELLRPAAKAAHSPVITSR